MREFQTNSINKFEDLLKHLSSFSHTQIDDIKKAYDYIKVKHANQFRKSGKSYIEHCLTVAFYVAQLNLDHISVISACYMIQ